MAKYYRFFKVSLILFFLGAVLGPIGDMCHVLSQTTRYPHDIHQFYFFGILPFWVPLLFGAASLLIGTSHPWVDRLFSPNFNIESRLGTKNLRIAAAGSILFLAAYCLSGILPYPDYVLGIVAGLTWLVLDCTGRGLFLAALTAAVGTLVEIYLVHSGVFSYHPRAASLFGVASWLPSLYAIASVTLGNLGRFLFRSSFGSK